MDDSISIFIHQFQTTTEFFKKEKKIYRGNTHPVFDEFIFGDYFFLIIILINPHD